MDVVSRFTVRVLLYGKWDSHGRVSHDLIYTDLHGRERATAFYANPGETIKRLRHNLAEQFWLDRKRKRLGAKS